jgi:hypothetical protein
MSDQGVLQTNLLGEFVIFLGDRIGCVRAMWIGLSVPMLSCPMFLIEEVQTGTFCRVGVEDIKAVLSPRRTPRKEQP